MEKRGLIEGMSIGTARRYLEARKKIDRRVDTIYALARMMSVFWELECDEIPLEPQAVGQIGKLIASDVCRIVSCLDEDFVHISDIVSSLDEAKRNPGSLSEKVDSI